MDNTLTLDENEWIDCYARIKQTYSNWRRHDEEQLFETQMNFSIKLITAVEWIKMDGYSRSRVTLNFKTTTDKIMFVLKYV